MNGHSGWPRPFLELGLHSLITESAPPTEAQSKQIVEALRQAGAVGPDLPSTIDYPAQVDNQAWQPIQTKGKPVSDIIIKQRRGLSGE